MVQIITMADLPVRVQEHELAATMVAGANARALRVAPCLAEPESAGARSEAKLILVGAVQRWSEAGSGAMQSVTAGPFGQTLDTRQRTGFNLWPSEIEVLQDLCSGDAKGAAFTVDTVPTVGRVHHDEACSVVFGASYCSCGAVLTGGDPLWPST